MAWCWRSRACLAEPPAESPSTINISESEGSLLEQSANFPGRAKESSTFLRRVNSRARRAASRAFSACIALSMIALAGAGFSSRNSANFCTIAVCTSERISVLPSFVFVCPSNCGSCNFTEMTAAKPSRVSSPVKLGSLSFKRPFARA